EAETIFHEALAADAGRAQARIGLAVVDLLRGEHGQAERRLRAAIESGPRHANLYSILSLSLFAQERSAEAVPYAERAWEMTRSHSAAVELAWALIDGDVDVERGLELARTARDEISPHPEEKLWTLPFTPSPEHCIGLAHLKQGRAAEAVSALEEAARLRPDRKRITADLERARRLL
ncbi:MAG: tetratricopeptide repeat protein, partial [Candidatus Eisenbacteria bacterium]|nr:tetratricopeptide repeat protein [Candidatus Latescibacterota bacterium]MBD3303350.1 tetratricopeptide repeat protein [Candidatus Eisenbacteria bacterium]